MDKHWNGSYLWEATVRPIDGSVLHAFNVAAREALGKDTYLSILDVKVAQTVSQYNISFCKEYPINVDDNTNKIPGILIGRYPGDHYAGGNPWQLLTATLGDLFYNASMAVKSTGLTDEQLTAWTAVLPALKGTTDKTVQAQAFVNAGDSVMERL